jgi:hypothetical protein
MFIKGDISFTVDQRIFQFSQKNISLFGVTGLPWLLLKPDEHFGRSIFAEIKAGHPHEIVITTPAQILREYEIGSQKMAVRFHLDFDQSTQLEELIKKHGTTPNEYARRFPRIPSLKMIQTFPLRALVKMEKPAVENEIQIGSSVICDVENISPNGILVSTENQISLSMMPGDSVHLTLDPRGWFPFQVQVQGTVRRITDDFNLESGNILRHIGIKFTHFRAADQKAFLALLKDILEQIKSKHLF